MTDHEAWVRFACAKLAVGYGSSESANAADDMLALYHERKFEPPRPMVLPMTPDDGKMHSGVGW